MARKFQFRISRQSMSFVHGLVTYGKWSRDNPVVVKIEVSRFHANAERACRIATQGAVDALNKELETQ